METNKIYNEDCLEGLKRLEDNSIDLVITDPPYNWGKDFENDNLEEKEYWEFIVKVFEELYRISKSWISVDIPRTRLLDFQKVICNKFIFYDYFCLAVNNSMANCGLGIDRFSLKIIAKKNQEDKIKHRKSNLFISHRSSTGKYTGHPTQKDLNGYKYIIQMLSNEGDLVLDCFMGSGTTAVACKQLNRNFIGFEISKDYLDMCNKRLEQETLNNGGKFFSSQP
jgi:DNA modification methylase